MGVKNVIDDYQTIRNDDRPILIYSGNKTIAYFPLMVGVFIQVKKRKRQKKNKNLNTDFQLATQSYLTFHQTKFSLVNIHKVKVRTVLQILIITKRKDESWRE